MKEIEIKLTNEFAQLPTRAHEGDAALDIYAAIEGEMLICPGSCVLISSGIAVNIKDPNIVGVLVSRSGLGHKNNIRLSNCLGVIDSEYQLTIGISLFNDSMDIYTVKRGDRIAQLMFMPVYQPELKLVTDFSHDTGRGGFGSSGV